MLQMLPIAYAAYPVNQEIESYWLLWLILQDCFVFTAIV